MNPSTSTPKSLDDTVIEHLARSLDHRVGEMFAVEQTSKAKAYAGLLYDLLCRDEEVRMVHQYLAGDVNALLGNALGMVRPPMRVKDQADRRGDVGRMTVPASPSISAAAATTA